MRMARQPRMLRHIPYCRNNPISSEDQSIGSTELIRNRGSAVRSRIAATRSSNRATGESITTPPPQIDARKHQLLPARLSKLTHRPQTLIQRNRTARPPSHRNNAERTPVPTPILDLQIRPRLMSVGSKRQRRNLEWAKSGSCQIVAARAPQCRRSLRPEASQPKSTRSDDRSGARSHTPSRSFDNKRLMAVPNHHIHAIKRRNFLRSTLRIAAGEDHPRLRTCPPHPPQKSARVAVRLSRHAASIENHNRCGSQSPPRSAQPRAGPRQSPRHPPGSPGSRSSQRDILPR